MKEEKARQEKKEKVLRRVYNNGRDENDDPPPRTCQVFKVGSTAAELAWAVMLWWGPPSVSREPP